MTAAFRPDEVVDITIKGVRVSDVDADGIVTVFAENPLGAVTRYEMPPQAAFERVAPAEWPPYLGDLWRDRDGDLWFARLAWDRDNAEYVTLCSTRSKPLDGWDSSTVYHVLRQYGPLTLVHREPGEAEGGASRG